MRESGTRYCISTTLTGLLSVIGCSTLSQPQTNYESLSQKPLSQWTSDDVVHVSQENIDEELPEDEKVKPLDKIGKTFQRISGSGPQTEKARQQFQLAENTFRAASAQRAQPESETASDDDFFAAAEQYEKAAALWPDSELEQDALFMAGESYYFGNHYPRANLTYEQLLKQYPETRHLDRVEARRFTISQYWLSVNEKQARPFYAFNWTDQTRPLRDDFGHAVKIYDRIRFDDPTGRLADDATLAAGVAYLKQADYHQADQYFTDLRTHFASSEHQFHAHLYGIQAKLQIYEGPDYSAEPLLGAEKLLKQIHRQFPQLAKRENETLNKAYAQVRFGLAERGWNAGKFYDQRKQYKAARLHYQQLLEDYPETPFSQQARDRLTQIADQPDSPPQAVPWLVKIFPDDSTVKPLIATSPLGNARR